MEPVDRTRRLSRTVLAIAALLTFCGIAAPRLAAQAALAGKQAAPAVLDTLSLDRPLPMDTAVRVGQLENGLRYYIRVNDRPADRAELLLVVRAGSVLEDDDQRGLAHFLEHMAFNGTRRFTRDSLVGWLESIGMRFGPDANASTGYDETIYRLTVPTNVEGALETAFRVLEDWAAYQMLDSAEIERERGVVIEEWRGRQGAAARMRARQDSVLLEGSRYLERPPIGDPDVIRSSDREALVRFYRDWYRPDLMAVIVVGDVDQARVDSLVRVHFGHLRGPPTPRPRPEFEVPILPGLRFAIATDPQQTSTAVTIYHVVADEPSVTVGDYREGLVRSLYDMMFNARLSELLQRPDPPFLTAIASNASYAPGRIGYALTVRTAEGQLERGLEAILTEARRVAVHGFTSTELERAKQSLLRGVERAEARTEDRTTSSFIGPLLEHVRRGTPVVAAEDIAVLNRRFLPGITLDEVNALAAERLNQESRIVRVSAPEKDGVPAPSEEALRAVLERVARADVAPWTDREASGPLGAEPPTPGRITAERRFDEIETIEWTLSNGARVVLRPSTRQKDEVLFRAISPGGHSLASDEDYVPALTAASVATAAGLGPFDLITLRKALAGKVVSVGPFISAYEEGLSGSASPRDLETLLQLIHLAFKGVRADTAAFLSLQQRLKADVANRRASPASVFADTVNAIMTGRHPRAAPPSPELYDRMDLGRSIAFFQDRFADASDFTFFFVGSLEPDSLRPLVERWLATLPAAGRVEAGRDLGVRPPEGVVEKVVRAGREPRARTQIIFSGPMVYSHQEASVLAALAEVLQRRLRESLREEQGGTYAVSVVSSVTRRPWESYRVSIAFGTDPARLEELTAEMFRQIERLQAEPPGTEEMVAVREARTRAREARREYNGPLLEDLVEAYRYGEDPVAAMQETRLYSITGEDVRRAAQRYLPRDRYVRVSLLPEEG